MIDLTKKRILITGASSGIGRACAILCSQLGAQVALLGRNEERLVETTHEMQGEGHRIYPFDLCDLDGIELLVSRICSEFGPLNGFVHSAGISNSRPLRLLKPSMHLDQYSLNVVSGFEVIRAIHKKGRYVPHDCSIILISSVMSILAEKAKTAYCASKAALVNGARVIALETASAGIRVNCISPGMVKTEMVERFSSRVNDKALKNIIECHPLGLGQPKDVASSVCFLLSNTARWITGTNLIVDGGYSCG